MDGFGIGLILSAFLCSGTPIKDRGSRFIQRANNMDTRTPVTDAQSCECGAVEGCECAPASLCRQLERQRDALSAELARVREALGRLLSACEEDGWPTLAEHMVPMNSARAALASTAKKEET